MTTGIAVFFAITMSLLIFIAIGWNVRSIIHYKKEVANLKMVHGIRRDSISSLNNLKK